VAGQAFRIFTASARFAAGRAWKAISPVIVKSATAKENAKSYIIREKFKFANLQKETQKQQQL
jgi:hypothetical protein